MEERKLNEKESLELIAQMIQNTKNSSFFGDIPLSLSACWSGFW